MIGDTFFVIAPFVVRPFRVVHGAKAPHYIMLNCDGCTRLYDWCHLTVQVIVAQQFIEMWNLVPH